MELASVELTSVELASVELTSVELASVELEAPINCSRNTVAKAPAGKLKETSRLCSSSSQAT